MLFPKPEKKQKERRGLQARGKPKKEPVPWRQGIFDHHKDRPSGTDRGDFPPKVIKELKEEADGVCQVCKSAPDTQTHHVMPRGRRSTPGRGVKNNGLRCCGFCHDRIQTNEDELQYWIAIYRDKYGDRFWYDDEDWKQFHSKKLNDEQLVAELQARKERVEPVVTLLEAASGRGLKAKESRFIEGLNDRDLSIVAGLAADLSRGLRGQQSHGYGHFED
ncbi:HNH endonuclease [Paenibacillus filicis]|uniref:HNH endonuclease n=1 Tax=Paenibacillus filicis TaxID=669464 RepID=A0ABU9DYC3_9BACL